MLKLLPLLVLTTLTAIAAAADPSSIRIATVDEPGVPLVVTGVVRDADGPRPGASLHVYHTDHTGCYSPGCRDESQRRLQGDLRTDADGRFRLETIRPASYPDSNIQQHIHFEIRIEGRKPVRGEILFADDPKLRDSHRRAAESGPDVIAEVRQSDGTARVDVELVVPRR